VGGFTRLAYLEAPKSGWTRVALLLPQAATRYIAFRYLLYDGGPNGSNSDKVCLDGVQIVRHSAPTSGPIAYYPFNGNANDQSGNGNNGTVYGGAYLISDRFGNSGSAYRFDGSGYVSINNSASLQLGTYYTISAWFRVDARGPSDWMGIVSKAMASTDGYAGPRVMMVESSPGSGLINFMGGGSRLSYSLWYHAALVHNGSQMQWYLDGNKDGVAGPSHPSWSFSNANPVTFASQNGSYRTMRGAVDDVRIFARALSDQEIADLYHENGWNGNVPPPNPAPLSPANGLTGVSTSPTFSWNSSAGATSYRLQVSTSSSFTSLVLDQGGIAGTSYQVGALSYNTVYYWRVSAANASGTSAYSGTWFFSTVMTPPAPPVLTSPGDGAPGVSTTPVFTWNPSAGASSYHLQVSTSSSFIGLIVDQAGITATSYSSAILSSNTVHYWRVNASNAGGASGYSSTRSFTTLPAIPAVPVLLSPANGSTQVAANPVFSWNPSPGAASYSLEVSTSSGFGTLTINQTGIASTNYQAAGLGYSTAYYWRMKAENTAGGSSYSSTWSFTTAPVTIPTGTLQVLVSDAENWGNAGSGAIVQLFDASGSQVGSQTTNASSIATFSGIHSETVYSYTVYDQPVAGSPWSTYYYWGTKSGVVISAGQTTADHFIHNSPYAPAINAYNNATNAVINNSTVLIGTTIRIELVIKNPTYSGATSQSSSGRVILDRDRAAGYDFDRIGDYQSYATGEIRNVAFYYTPSDTGAYYYTECVTTSVSGNALLTDGSGWGGPLFTAVQGDIEAPGAPVNLAATPSGWQNGVSFTLDWTSPTDPSGVAAAWYKVGSVPVSATDGTRSTNKPMSVGATAEGGQNIFVWLEDGVGNKNHAARAVTMVYYDGTAPTGGTIAINGGGQSTSGLLVTLNSLGANDAGGSGLSQMSFSNDNSTWSAWEPVVATKASWNLSLYGGTSAAGTKIVYVRYADVAGNASAGFSDEISYEGSDVTAPGNPMSVTATPANWTNINPFSVDWVNPADPSGIAAVWYKRGVPPASSTDGTRTTAKPLVVPATAQGGQMVHLWLEDGSGNKNYANTATVQIFFDESAPTGGTIAINGGAASTSSLLVMLNSLGASDAGGSGLSQMRFSNDSFAWTSWESYTPTRAGWDLSSDGGGTAGGEKTVYAQYRDAAGNVSATTSDKIVYATTSVQLWNSGVPERLALHQNFPNPFNPTTVIRFDIPASSEVSLIVANVLGEEVAVLASGQKEPGSYGVQFEAARLPSGIYFYRLRVGDFVETRKLLLLR